MSELFNRLLKEFDYKVSFEPVFQTNIPDAMEATVSTDTGVLSFVFSKLGQVVYSIAAYSMMGYSHGAFDYFWENPDHPKMIDREPEGFWDGAEKTIDLDVLEDILEKGKAILANEPFDTRVVIMLDIDDDLQMELFRMAHERDITLNQLFEQMLKAVIAEHEQNDGIGY